MNLPFQEDKSTRIVLCLPRAQRSELWHEAVLWNKANIDRY